MAVKQKPELLNCISILLFISCVSY